jgi:TPR repeat protein
VVYADVLLPRDSWPWVLLREAGFTFAGQGKYTESELDRLLQAEEVGPLGCLAVATLTQGISPSLARRFAERGRSRLTAAEFRKDYSVLLQTNSILGQILNHAFALSRILSEGQLASLAASLPPAEAALFRQGARLVGNAKEQLAGEAAWPAFEQHWDQTVRPHLESGLNHFVPQVQAPANSAALYERGLAMIAEKAEKQDFEEAIRCFSKAANLGHSGAQLQLGMLYHAGKGVPKNLGEALRWYRAAMEQQEPHATCRMGDYYRDVDGADNKNFDEAVKWYRVEAEKNCPDAQFNLGQLFNMRNNMPEALKWYHLAAEGGFTAAQNRLGYILSDELFSTPDFLEACQWLSLAAGSGDKVAEIRLASLKAKLTPDQWGEAQTRATAVTLRLKKLETTKKQPGAPKK